MGDTIRVEMPIPQDSKVLSRCATIGDLMSEYPKLRFVKYIYLDPSDNKLKGVNPPGITPLVKNSYITFVGEYGEVIRFVTDLSSC